MRIKLKKVSRVSTVLMTVASVFLGTLVPVQAADIFDLVPGGRTSQGYYGVTFEESQSGPGESISRISSNLSPQERVNNINGTFHCTSMDDPECSKGSYVAAQIILPPCSQASDRMCIEGLTVGLAGKSTEKAKLLREVTSLTSPADAMTGLPKGGGPSIWQVESNAHAGGGLTYGVIAQVKYFQDRKKSGAQGNRNAPLNLNGMKLKVVPIKLVNGKYSALEVYKTVLNDGSQSIGFKQSIADFDNTGKCAWLESGSCGEYAEFAADTRVGLSLRMGSDLTGWLYGRMKNVNVEVNPLDGKFNQIMIEGDSVAIPGAYGFIKKNEIKNFPKMEQLIKLGNGDFGYNQMMTQEGTVVGGYDPIGNFEDFSAFEPILKTIPSGGTQWVIAAGRSANGVTPGTDNPCFQDTTKLSGIVTTNAFVYAPGAPEFSDGFINYKVAGLHHQADGVTLTRGTYDLAVRSSVARCLYGFSNAPISATISVVGNDGQAQTIATEIVRQDAKKEWLYLAARNFTFSSPIIKVKITQEAQPVAQPSKSPQKTAIKSITCQKGKLKKKVSGLAPTCPKGYKKI